MKPRLKSTSAARDLIKAHEPFLAKAKRRGKKWFVGYGHTAAAREGVELSPSDAELLLIYDVMQAEQAIDASIGAEMAAAMRDALVSFAVSVGVRAFKVSDVARLARDGRHREAATAIETWVRAEEDGRLIVSERLTRRRFAEKTLYLKGLENGASIIAPIATTQSVEPVAPDHDHASPVEDAITTSETKAVSDGDPSTQYEADNIDHGNEAQVEQLLEKDEAGSDIGLEEPSELVELDIIFETPSAEAVRAGASEEEQAENHASLVSDVRLDAEDPQDIFEESHEEHAEPSTNDASAPEAATQAPILTPTVPVDGSVEDPIKIAQDAAIAAVMTRMAGQMADSVRNDLVGIEEPVQLGYSFLSTAHVDINTAETPQVSPVIQSAKKPVTTRGNTLLSAPLAPMSPMSHAVSVSTIAVAPTPHEKAETGQSINIQPEEAAFVATELSDQHEYGADGEVEPGEAETTHAVEATFDQPSDHDKTDVFVEPSTISDTPVETVPPHPSHAPATAPGLSGDVEGPDHPEDDEFDAKVDDGEELHPTVVAGAEAPSDGDAETQPNKGGDMIFMASLFVGCVMTGLGGMEIASHLDEYLELGLEFSPMGPVVFGAGVLLTTASAWFVIGRRSDNASAMDDRPTRRDRDA